jgi:hypothetical protein
MRPHRSLLGKSALPIASILLHASCIGAGLIPLKPHSSHRGIFASPTEDDHRPDKKYWDLVKEEMTIFLCTSDKKYKELWRRIDALEKKNTTAIVALVSAYLGETLGAPATVLAGFVAVCLYGAIKIGKEALCRYLHEQDT